jgi:hypothetical protein
LLLCLFGLVVFFWVKHEQAKEDERRRLDAYQKTREDIEREYYQKMGRDRYFSMYTGMSEKRFVTRRENALKACSATSQPSKEACVRQHICDQSPEEYEAVQRRLLQECKRANRPPFPGEYFDCAREVSGCNRFWWRVQDYFSE